MNVLDAVDAASLKKGIINFRSGDEIKIHVRVIEGSKSRIQVFQGVVIRRQGAGIRETFTIRKLSYGVGFERTFQFTHLLLKSLKWFVAVDVRRAKLYYLRDLRGKASKIKERRGANNEFIVEDVVEEVIVEEVLETPAEISNFPPETTEVVAEVPAVVEETPAEAATETEQA